MYHNYRSPCTESSTTREAHLLQLEKAPAHCNERKPVCSNEDPAQPPKNKFLKKA